MNFFNRIIERVFVPFKPLPPGVYPYQTPPDAPMQYRLHLRIEPDGEGILVVNAKTVLHLNQTATEFIFHLVQKTPEESIIEEFARRYHVKKDQALQDYRQLTQRIQELISTPDLDPETFLDFQRLDPHFKDLSAPLRLDCALTYRVSEQVAPTALHLRIVHSAVAGQFLDRSESRWLHHEGDGIRIIEIIAQGVMEDQVL